MSKKNSLSKGIAINIVATALLRSISILTAPVTTRILSTSDYGAMSVYNTWCGILGVVIGLQTYGSLNNAKINQTPERYKRFCGNAILLSFISHLAALLCILPFQNAVASALEITPLLVVLLIPNSFFQFCISFMNAYLLIDAKAGKNLLLSLYTTLVSFGLSVYFALCTDWFSEAPYMAFIMGHLLTGAVSCCTIFIWFISRCRIRLEKEDVGYCLKLSLPLIFHGLAGMVLGQSDRVMLQRLSSVSSAGVYSFTYSFGSILSSIWSAINAIWVPTYYRYLKEKNYSEMRTRMEHFDFLFSSLAVGFLLVCPEVFKWLSAPSYWTQLNIMPALVMAATWNHLYSYPANYEFFHEQSKWIAVGSSGAAIANILLNLWMIPLMGASGAAFATTLSYMLLFFYHELIARKIIKNYPILWSSNIKRLLPSLAACVLYTLCIDLWAVRWSIAAVVGAWLIIRLYRQKAIL